jgi:hypothetical protein
MPGSGFEHVTTNYLTFPVVVRRAFSGTLRRPARLVWIGATLVALLASLPALAVIAQPAPDRLDYHAEEFDRGVEAVPGALQVKSGFTPGVYGWYLGPGLSGDLTYAIHKQRGQDLLLTLWLYSGGPVSADLSVRLDDGPMLLSVHNPKFTGEVLNLPPSTREANVIELDLRSTD